MYAASTASTIRQRYENKADHRESIFNYIIHLQCINLYWLLLILTINEYVLLKCEQIPG